MEILFDSPGKLTPAYCRRSTSTSNAGLHNMFEANSRPELLGFKMKPQAGCPSWFFFGQPGRTKLF